ncbi:PBECR2 nuclease fold domain-containing protein [Clostridium grantii]|uniref:Phage-Barnase-EndoU-ColicinE5/D-RelE like nuclease 3 domain-containing protein n=1 Tax=Clostridium grantii DSM 8605 TaxID=1121316 RepID=A0A1M5TMI6_9CLOT|nr:PBECR2 nuclease fold domain-containing protein [Clostridium grantii]SHH52025.1 hypothetical protein SAMN02745207_01393 [Clostridium grantii DSM 8605]
MSGQQKVGELTQKVIDTLGLSMIVGTPILCGPANKNHMQNEHPQDFEKYGSKLDEIITSPSYICKHPNKPSIEYVKVFKDENNEHVLVAVRASGKGVLFDRTLFVMDPIKVQAYKNKGAFNTY